MDSPSIRFRRLAWLGLALLSAIPTAPRAEAGDLFHKKGQLIAVPVPPAAGVLQAVPSRTAEVTVLHTPASPSPKHAGSPQAPGQSPPAIHITVIEAQEPASAPAPSGQSTAQTYAAPQQYAQQYSYVTMQPQAVTYAAPIVYQAVSVQQVQQAVPVQLYYLPATPRRSLFKKH